MSLRVWYPLAMADLLRYRILPFPDGLPDHDSALELYLNAGQRIGCAQCSDGDEGAVKITYRPPGLGRDPITEWWKITDPYSLQLDENEAGGDVLALMVPRETWRLMRIDALKAKLKGEAITKNEFVSAVAAALEMTAESENEDWTAEAENLAQSISEGEGS